MKQTKQNEHDVPVSQSGDEKSPYLPSPRGAVKEKIARLKYSAAYWIWKRMIHKYCCCRMPEEKSIRFLDIGCGSGNFLCCLENWFPDSRIVGLDNCPELLQYVSARTSNVNLLQGNGEELHFEDEAFHVLSALQVIEHLPNPEAFVGNAYRVLKDDGLLLLATPNPISLAARLLGNQWGGIRPDHISIKSPEQWNRLLEKSGFEVLDKGTTVFNGIPLIGQFPLELPFQLLQVMFGWFPWKSGSSYMVVAKKNKRQ